MGSDNIYACNRSSIRTASRIGLMATIFVVFMVFVGVSRNGNGKLRSGQSTIKTTHDANQYDNYDWKELPNDIKTAAKNLGYSQQIWDDYNTRPPIFESLWVQLDAVEQEAAIALGYNAKTWCNDDDGTRDEETSVPSEEFSEEDWEVEDWEEDSEEDSEDKTMAPTGEDTEEDTEEDTDGDTDGDMEEEADDDIVDYSTETPSDEDTEEVSDLPTDDED
uniref:Uncharacterized protein n=1 Tax=Pseudo-nitzschia australis TaxID=44445 RepID=A0A7S4AAC5_9STRA|mmetsp:Transcript_26455/g.57971  ORF Transcript_26455/g.57971 Transcript_26455/m.57971 type:complete len:220 (-) Transcript_26455:387-1046(-)|eukprot:CAMPEP_0168185106 /NCGR_PEP_ID=MMETSP0139_2-20121125/13635_1 /TAXON_ID=44445 /ORGANISM="Pseudo-nitzschia australis, Strain 10249 10 AB" /LENGTH=219 /DNA_ID=CAMNT_0008106851 /DNA_START=51 /DNA_END=710 /DNA_ORIENTATION=+